MPGPAAPAPWQGASPPSRTPVSARSYTRPVTDIAALRKSYELAQFAAWLEQAIAARLPEPNAMTLATVGADGRPSTRIVLIKGYDARGIVWYTNYQSRKGRELAIHPFAALQFHCCLLYTSDAADERSSVDLGGRRI